MKGDVWFSLPFRPWDAESRLPFHHMQSCTILLCSVPSTANWGVQGSSSKLTCVPDALNLIAGKMLLIGLVNPAFPNVSLIEGESNLSDRISWQISTPSDDQIHIREFDLVNRTFLRGKGTDLIRGNALLFAFLLLSSDAHTTTRTSSTTTGDCPRSSCCCR